MADVLTSTYNPAAMGTTIFEDVENLIQNITPYKTPFIASIGKSKAKNTLTEWLEDEIKKPTGTNSQIEGRTPEATLRNIPDRMNNQTQIIDDTFLATATQDAVDTIGRATSSKYQLGKSLKYLNTELEYAAINNLTKNAGAAGTARQMMGMAGFITTNDSSFATNANTNLFTEDMLMQMAEDVFDACEDDAQNLLVGGAVARQIAGWDQNSRVTVNTNASEKKLVMAVLVLETPFGRINIVIDRYIELKLDTANDYTTAYLYEPGKMSIAWLRNWKTEEMAKTTDGRKYYTVGEMALKVHSEKAAAKCGGIFAKAHP